MKKIILTLLLSSFLFVPSTFAEPGNYTVRVLAGPSFNIADWGDQFRFGGEFDYDMGYSLHIGLLSLAGLGSDKFSFKLIPGFSYNFLYIGPASFHALGGVGYGIYDKDSGMDLRVSTGVSLPLGDAWEAYSDINYYISPLGTTGTPSTFDWMLGFGFLFK